ncbi:MAG: hypothetical protein LUJ25_06070 [Firmicutes bacterium]|nr:hypothetical protein [Bacillota bacterium]
MIAETATAAILFFGYLAPDGEVIRLPEYGTVYFDSKQECEDTIRHEVVIKTWGEEIGDNFILFCAPVKEGKSGK